MLILDLLGIGFHAVVVFGLGKDFLFHSRTLWAVSLIGCAMNNKMPA